MSVSVWILRLVVHKTCKPSGTSSVAALTQVAHLQKGYMLSGSEVYFCDLLSFLFMRIIGYVSQHPMLLLGGSEIELKRS
jgi:hypothetical protein